MDRLVAPARWPSVIEGIGGSLAAILAGEVVAVALFGVPAPDAFGIGLVTSAVFVGGLVFGGHWLRESDLDPARYPRIGTWCLGCLLGFTLIVGSVLTVVQIQPKYLFLVGGVRWSASLGGGTGLAIGVFEARAIERERRAEQLRLQQDALERERDRLSEFAQTVAHDLRAPLQVADGHLELVREECDSDRLDSIARSHDRMWRIVDETFTLARQGRLVEETEPVDIAAFAATCWGDFTADAQLRTEGTVVVDADRSRLRHVFENLFENAIQHGDDDLTIRVGPLTGTTGFYVEDTGSGIPAEHRGEVFDPGYTGPEGDTGYGLTIVRRIVRAHGWTVSVTDSDAGGARFEIVCQGSRESPS